jgi:hypothetical protein
MTSWARWRAMCAGYERQWAAAAGAHCNWHSCPRRTCTCTAHGWASSCCASLCTMSRACDCWLTFQGGALPETERLLASAGALCPGHGDSAWVLYRSILPCF